MSKTCHTIDQRFLYTTWTSDIPLNGAQLESSRYEEQVVTWSGNTKLSEAGASTQLVED